MPPPLQAEVRQVGWEAGVVLQVGFLVAGQPWAGRHRGVSNSGTGNEDSSEEGRSVAAGLRGLSCPL